MSAKRPGWELNTGLFEVFWKRGPKGLYADRIRVCGVTFYYISGKKATKSAEQKRERGEGAKPWPIAQQK